MRKILAIVAVLVLSLGADAADFRPKLRQANAQAKQCQCPACDCDVCTCTDGVCKCPNCGTAKASKPEEPATDRVFVNGQWYQRLDQKVQVTETREPARQPVAAPQVMYAANYQPVNGYSPALAFASRPGAYGGVPMAANYSYSAAGCSSGR